MKILKINDNIDLSQLLNEIEEKTNRKEEYESNIERTLKIFKEDLKITFYLEEFRENSILLETAIQRIKTYIKENTEIINIKDIKEIVSGSIVISKLSEEEKEILNTDLEYKLVKYDFDINKHSKSILEIEEILEYIKEFDKE